MSSPLQFVEYWKSVRGRTMRIIPCIPRDRFDWAPAVGRWSFGDTLRHLAGIERGMYAETVLGRPSAYPGHGTELSDGPEGVVAYLERAHTESVAIFSSLTSAQWEGKTLTPAGTSITTWKWLRAMVEHEAHHRGQMYLMLGLLGVEAPPLYGLTEQEVRRNSPGALVTPGDG